MIEILLFKGAEEVFWDEINGELKTTPDEYFADANGQPGIYKLALHIDGKEIAKTVPLGRLAMIRVILRFHDLLVEEGNLDGAEGLLPVIDKMNSFTLVGKLKAKKVSLALIGAGLFLIFSCCRILLRVMAGIFFPERFKLDAIPLIIVINILLLVFMVWGICYFYKRLFRNKH